MDVMYNCDCPGFRTIACGALVVWRSCGANVKPDGLKPAPEPKRSALLGPPGRPKSTFRNASVFPEVVGVNVTVKAQLPPAGIVGGQLLVC